MPLTFFLAQVYGLGSLILGVSVLFKKNAFIEMVDGIVTNRALTYAVGVTTVFLGLLAVLSHNIWDQGTLPLMVTLFGWAVLLKGINAMFASHAAMTKYVRVFKFGRLYWLYALIIIVIGAYFTIAGFAA